jgi:hypothetical protein
VQATVGTALPVSCPVLHTFDLHGLRLLVTMSCTIKICSHT